MLAPQGVKFAAFDIPEDRADLPPGVSRLVVVPELREVRVQIRFSRFAALSANLQHARPHPAPGPLARPASAPARRTMRDREIP